MSLLKFKQLIFISLFVIALGLVVALLCIAGGSLVDYLFITFANTGLFFSFLLLFIFIAGAIVVFGRLFFFIVHLLFTRRLLYDINNIDSLPEANVFLIFRNHAREFRAASEEGIYSDDIIEHARESAMADCLDSQEIDNGRTWLEFLGVVAPTVGFMGTLVGLITAFQELGAGGELSGLLQGLGLSMTTSLLGAIISVIFLSSAWILGKLRRSFDGRLYKLIALAQQKDRT